LLKDPKGIIIQYRSIKKMTRDSKFYNHLKAFLMSHQVGLDPYQSLAKIKRIANSNPDNWDGKLPKRGFEPDINICKIVESTKSRPLIPWWWYAEQHEPIPSVVQNIYKKVVFDFALVYPQQNAWIYLLLEPSKEIIGLLQDQDHMRAFILISLINKNFDANQRENARLRLGRVMASPDMKRIFVFSVVRAEDPTYRNIPKSIPAVIRVVQPKANTTNWDIRLPGIRQSFGSFGDVISAI
jgi:hypothetical protein